MIDAHLTGTEDLSRAAVQAVSLGPVIRGEILAMASLSGDFHPCRTLPDAAKAAGLPALVLHSNWISGLVVTGVRLVAGRATIRDLRVEYEAPAYEGDVLRLELDIDGKAVSSGRGLSFTVRDQRGRPVAHGSGTLSEEPA
jgi:acyl dehydratase